MRHTTAAPPWSDAPRCADLTRARGYTETYQYDPAGNLAQLQHQATDAAFTRALACAPNANRLATLTIGAMTYA